MHLLPAVFLVLGFACTTRVMAQEKFIVSTDAGGLYEVDVDACHARLIGYSPVTFLDIAFTPDGRLWGTLEQNLYLIDTTDASATLIGSSPGFRTPGLVQFNNDILLGEDDGWLHGIRTIDGSTWPIAPLGYYVSGDLTWYEGQLYITATGPYRLVRMHVEPDLSAVTDIQVVGLLGGGVGQWYGANTTLRDPCAPDPYLMLALDRYDLYRVSPVDAGVQLLCPDLFPFGTHGAASFGESQVAPAIELSMPNVFTPNRDGVNEQFAPVHGTGRATWHLKVFDRWGNKVHESGAPNVAWDGRTVAGEPCSEGVYYYLLEIDAECLGTQFLKGAFSLLR